MMTKFKTPVLIAAAAFALSACAMPFAVSRDAPLDLSPVLENPTQDWSIAEVEINVPRSLTVSEANSIKPAADIVWREDPLGDRYEQVETLMRQALEPMMQPREDAAVPVIVSLDVTRFHALTERARYTIGGEHEVEFMVTVRNAETGMALTEAEHIDLTFRAYGGQQAIRNEQQGITQRVRITERLQDWARAEFPGANGEPVLLQAAAD